MQVQMSAFIPFLSWIRAYGRHHVKADLVAGLTVAVVAVPQSMAYALIAGLPVQYGLYASKDWRSREVQTICKWRFCLPLWQVGLGSPWEWHGSGTY
jgi:hypothetical protein